MSSTQSPWQTNVPRINQRHRHWLNDADSLTLKLKRHCYNFRVIRSFQNKTRLELSESKPLGLTTNTLVMTRNVILLCDEIPVVIGHTVTPLATLSRHWHFFNALGQKALGLALFINPLITRQTFEYTRLNAKDTLYQLTQDTLSQHGYHEPLPRYLWARRCVFTHKKHQGSRMMVTEVMLPAIYALRAHHQKTRYEHG